ncbi:glycoside hydrolase family 16 protein [Sphaerobolus stellatus SS14]|uniref:Glycoside hydrolase family 16 protein n=1 Tax=Sphaerobolus stellatus (strain SS14) TaxID=990650 RepID=A0A0C9UAE2_SPHS4|nr:glycoside hydrolase family 16 protein [Sphaerobolus stellatus SS14]
MRALLSLLASLLLLRTVSAYNFVREYSGSSFFDRWTFFGSFDNLTNGDVNFADKATAFNTSNPLVMVNSAQNVVIKVDNASTVLPTLKRTSVRIDSTDQYGIGTLLITDIAHMPFGCSVWPAIFTRGQNWPTHGEIDIIEGWNQETQNLMSLHTLDGCNVPNTINQLGTLQSGNCNDQNATVGCGVMAPATNPSFGQDFNNNGGGVWATQFDETGIFIWFWNRSSVPSTLQKNTQPKTLDPSTFGTPVASFPNTTCNIGQFFGPQTLSLDITLCGDAAGNAAVYAETCANEPPNSMNLPPLAPGQSPCYPNNVVGPGSPRYDEAFFEIPFMRAYTLAAVSTSTGAATNSAGATGTSGSGSQASGGGSTGSSAASLVEPFPVLLSFLVVFAGAIFGQWLI